MKICDMCRFSVTLVVFLYSERFCVEKLIAQQCLYHRVVKVQLLFNTNKDNYTCIEAFRTLAVILDPPV